MLRCPSEDNRNLADSLSLDQDIGKSRSLSLSHRRKHRTSRGKHKLRVFLRRNRIGKVFRRNNRNLGNFPADNLCSSNLISRTHKLLQCKTRKTVAQKRLMILPVVWIVQSYRNQTPPIPGRAGYKDPSSSLCVSGLYSIRAFQHPKQFIMISQRPVSCTDSFGGYGFGKIGFSIA